MVNIGSTLPTASTTKVSRAVKGQEGQLTVSKQVDAQPSNPVIDRRKPHSDRRKQKQNTMMDLRSGRDRRRNGNAEGGAASIDISA